MKALTPVLSAALMRRCDDHTINTLAIPSQVLMERAARGVVEYMESRAHIFYDTGDRVLVLCGSGNNGGDGFAVARFLNEGTYGKARRVSVCYCGKIAPDGSPDKTQMSPECARQYEYLCQALVPVFSHAQVEHSLNHADTVVDAVFGIGLDRPITGDTAALINKVNERHIPVLAVDIPSGIHGDTGEIMGTAIKASATVTMQALKEGLLRSSGASLCGEIAVCDIGVDLSPAAEHTVYAADHVLLATVMAPRDRRSHKGTYGQLGLVCGSFGMGGAAILSAKGALHTGAGLIRVVTPACNREIIQISVPEAVVTCYDHENIQLQKLISAISGCDGVVIGCGLGKSQQALTLLGALLEALPVRHDFPVVLDADALNLIAENPWLWNSRLLAEGKGQVIMTPHPAEMARLTQGAVGDILATLPETALAFAKEHGVTVVLKDAYTAVASPNGSLYLCPYGNAGMAKGGSGDVLAGIIGSLAVQKRKEWGASRSLAEIAAAGVALHALAGDAAAEVYGEFAMTPSDLIEKLGEVSRKFSDTRTKIIEI
ncbi:MAG: NAD(P)H-hydrate dehydratase [Clostridia bacterium]|nr:NAD(P)H-hydrate dehydratase [Clostridia bacterium]